MLKMLPGQTENLAGYSACLELLFADESDDFADRIRLASDAGLTAFEFWLWSNKDIDSIEKAMRQTGMKLVGFVAEPMISLVDRNNHDQFLDGLARSISVAKRLGAANLYIQAGDPVAGQTREMQPTALVDCLKRAADVLEGTGITLLLEPVNSIIDHIGCFLDRSGEGLDIIARVGRPEVRLLYDIYHSSVMGDDTIATIGKRMDLIGHVHIADHPGRSVPGSGQLDLYGDLNWVFGQGYDGLVGLEYLPQRPTVLELNE